MNSTLILLAVYLVGAAFTPAFMVFIERPASWDDDYTYAAALAAVFWFVVLPIYFVALPTMLVVRSMNKDG